MTRKGFKSDETMVVIVINGNYMTSKHELMEMLTSSIKEIKSIFLNINTKKQCASW